MHSLPGKVVIFCETNRGDANDCVDWAVDALCRGEDSPSLRILAGLMPPLSSYEVRDYALKALRELGFVVPKGAEATAAYARDLVEEIVKSPEMMQRNLRILCDICIEEDYRKDIYDFFVLRWAYDDLQESEVQWYWNGADRSNIDKIVLERCRDWLAEYEIQGSARRRRM